MNQRIAAFILGAWLLPSVAYAEINTKEVLELSQRFEPRAYDYVQENGAKIIPTRDGRSFIVVWTPEGFDPQTGITFVSLHGHANWATKNFQIWHRLLAKKGFAYVGIQWWYGRSAESIGYAKPRDIYPWIREALEDLNVPPGRVIFEGFSMGGVNSYAVAYLDRREETPYFGVVISNSGSMEADFKPNRPFLDKIDGPKPFAGAHWILYCSEHDQEHSDACEKMDWTKEVLEERGAVVDRYTRDPIGDHGGFMKNNHAESALALAESIIGKA